VDATCDVGAFFEWYKSETVGNFEKIPFMPTFSFIYKTNYYVKYIDINQHSYAFPHTALSHLNISPDE